METNTKTETTPIEFLELKNLLFEVMQVMNGWHADGTVWSEYDEEVRQRVLTMQKRIEELGQIDDTRGLLKTICDWEKDLSEYMSLESKLKKLFFIMKVAEPEK